MCLQNAPIWCQISLACKGHLIYTRKRSAGARSRSGAFVQKFVNLDFKSYLKFLYWMSAALCMPQPELIDHARLDSIVYLTVTLEKSKLTYSDIDKLSISNIPTRSNRMNALCSLPAGGEKMLTLCHALDADMEMNSIQCFENSMENMCTTSTSNKLLIGNERGCGPNIPLYRDPPPVSD
ncbi:hypothetical protein L1887_01034 [Cichorium endivia]|nr:hypothetical protein L1887_01034 [Cichorium endivia]